MVKQSDIIIAVLQSGPRPGMVVEAPDPENEMPTVHAVLFHLGSDTGSHHSGTSRFVGRFADTESSVGSGTFPIGSWHWPDQAEPKALTQADLANSAKPQRPNAEVGDRVLVGDGNKPGEIVAVEKGVATLIRLDDGTEATDTGYVYANEQKAQADADFQASKQVAEPAATKADKKK